MNKRGSLLNLLNSLKLVELSSINDVSVFAVTLFLYALGTMSEANTTAQSAHNMAHILQDSATTSQIKLPEKSSKSKPTLSLFSSGEREDFGNSFGNEGVGYCLHRGSRVRGHFHHHCPTRGVMFPVFPRRIKWKTNRKAGEERGKCHLWIKTKMGKWKQARSCKNLTRSLAFKQVS